MSSCAICALLSLRDDTWQSEHVLVSVARTVCGTNVLNACPLKPSAEIVCCCEYTHSRLGFCEPTTTAHVERVGEILCPMTVPSMPSMNTSSRSAWKLYAVQLRCWSPS